jgi:hypothetical protein
LEVIEMRAEMLGFIGLPRGSSSSSLWWWMHCESRHKNQDKSRHDTISEPDIHAPAIEHAPRESRRQLPLGRLCREVSVSYSLRFARAKIKTYHGLLQPLLPPRLPPPPPPVDVRFRV